jgi:hypothetical protein
MMKSFASTIVLALTGCMAASVCLAAQAPVVEHVRPPQRLAIYYGIPSLVNGAAGDVDRAVSIFGAYDAVVFGDGLQYDVAVPGRPSAGPVERQRTAAIVRRLGAAGRTQVFGYVPLGHTANLSMPMVADAVRRWKALGVHGVFFDEAGYDFGVTRQRQNGAIEAAHAEGLRVFLNAFDPADVLVDQPRLGARDLYLLESFLVRNGRLEDVERWHERARKAHALTRANGVRVWTVTTTEAGFDQDLCAAAWWGAVLWGFEGFGWGEPVFSAPTSVLPSRTCGTPGLPDVPFTSGVLRSGLRFTRQTARGRIEVDLARRAGRFIRLQPRVRPSVPVQEPRLREVRARPRRGAHAELAAASRIVNQ